MTQKLLDNYYGIMSEFRQELYNNIKDALQKAGGVIELYNTEEFDDDFYDLPSFFRVGKYEQHDTYYIVKIKKNLDIVGISVEAMEECTSSLLELSTDTLYDVYLLIKDVTIS